MSSNEHPDMSGNWSDVPYVCEKCGCRFTDDAKLSGSFFSTETILCSQECSVEYDYAIAEQLAADNARLRELLRECLGLGLLTPSFEPIKDKIRKELGQ